MKFSIIIPLYNRPNEIDELLESLMRQTFKDFDVIIVEDGSSLRSDKIVEKYQSFLDIKYYYKGNSGPGTTRNYGAERSQNDYYIFFDSDCIIPDGYMAIVNQQLTEHYTDCYGGPDAAMPNFSPVQKAISYAMTSIISTGGIRGASEKAGKFHPRSFNMGFSRKVFEATGGFSTMRFGEDIDMTLRIIEGGFDTQLIKEAFVFHKRRTDFRKFFRQVYNSGCARINLNKRHPGSLKLVHTLPACFLIGEIICVIAAVVSGIITRSWQWPLICISPLLLLSFIILIDSWRRNGLKVAILSVQAVYVQLSAYGMGFVKALWNTHILKKATDTTGFVKNFYK